MRIPHFSVHLLRRSKYLKTSARLSFDAASVGTTYIASIDISKGSKESRRNTLTAAETAELLCEAT